MSQSHTTVAIDARYFEKPDTGIFVFLCAIIRLLLDNDITVTLVVAQPPTVAPDIVERCEVAVLPYGKRMKKAVWAQLSVPKFLQKNKFDYYYSPANYGVPVLYFGKTKLLLTVLDLIPLHFFGMYFKKLPIETCVYFFSTLFSLWKADTVMAVSKATAEDIRHRFGRRSVETLIPIRYMGFTADIPAKPPVQKQFVYNGGRDPRKNVPMLLEAFAQFHPQYPQYKLVLMGGGYDTFDADLQRLGIANAVVKTGYVSHDEKMRILAESAATVYPSLMEGYGLPIVEALSVGTPILCGTGGSQREIAGEAGIFIEPLTAETIAAALRQVAEHNLPADYTLRLQSQLAYLLDVRHETVMAYSFRRL